LEGETLYDLLSKLTILSSGEDYMKRPKIVSLLLVVSFLSLLFLAPLPGRAQEATPTPAVQPTVQPLLIYTAYPSLIIGFGETVDVPLKVRGSTPQTVKLDVLNLPQGWTATFRGGSQIVDAVFLDGQSEASVDLRLEPPADVKAGTYNMVVTAAGTTEKSQLPLSFTLKEKLPPGLSLTVDGLPDQQGSPSGPFNYTASLKNEGDVDLVVVLSATQPQNMQVTIQNAGQKVNQIQLPANSTQSLSITAEPLVNLDAGKYPFTVDATAGDVKASLDLTAEVVGTGSLTVTSPDGNLSGQATAGQDSPLKVELSNTGTAPVNGVQLTSTEPTGWTVTFDQTQVAQIPAGQKVDVTAHVKPADNAVAGDYMITVNARPLDSKQASADYRITVRTSTIWGIVGIALIALAVVVVGVAVVRFGRR
jgi:uncharacterized membrane protein